VFFEKQSHDGRGDKSDQQLNVKPVGFEIDEFPPVDKEHGNDSAKLDIFDEEAGKSLLVFGNVHERRYQRHMTG